jgi:hypothetical protein
MLADQFQKKHLTPKEMTTTRRKRKSTAPKRKKKMTLQKWQMELIH